VALRSLDDGELLGRLGDSVAAGLRGSAEATRRYVADYRLLTRRLLAEARAIRPDLVVQDEHGLTPVDARGRRSAALLDVLEHRSAEAPFSGWVGRLDVHEAVAVDLASRVRMLLGLDPYAEPTNTPEVADDLAAQRFLRRVRFHLDHPDDDEPLRRVMRALDLSKTETARLFGVTRQAIDGWLANGVPAERQEKLTALLALCDLLERKLKPDRLPGIARRPADAYGDRTMLAMIAADRHRELLTSVRASFDWSAAA
jgi:transcriptional regulator with XRE-family HTH domain